MNLARGAAVGESPILLYQLSGGKARGLHGFNKLLAVQDFAEFILPREDRAARQKSVRRCHYVRTACWTSAFICAPCSCLAFASS